VTGLPRLLPLAAIATVGVLAINALENGPGVIGAARGFAEGVAAKSAGSPKAASPLPADASLKPGGVAPAQAVAAKPAPICAESPAQLARDAGLSPAELQVIQSLGARRGELDAREQGLDTQLALIQAAEAKVDARIATMNGLKADMQALLGQLDDKQQAEVDRLVKVYEVMKPQDAAARFTLLSDDVRLPIAAKMKERALSAIIAKMPPPDAKRLTELLAARYVAQAAAARQAINPAASQPAASTPAPATASASKPARLASASPPPPPPGVAQTGASQPTAGSPADASAPAAKPVHRKPHRAKPAAAIAAAGNAAPAPPQISAQTTSPAKPAAPSTSPTAASRAATSPSTAATAPAKSG
jgi:flagellar motility protein MotE (MotC chaperone)